MQPLVTYMQNRNRPQSVFAAPPHIFNWPQVIVGLTDVVLHLLVVFLLIFWLYRTPKAKKVAPEAKTAAASHEHRQMQP